MKEVGIGIIGVGNIGSYLFKEINSIKSEINKNLGFKIKIIGVAAKNSKKKRAIKINKNLFYKNPIDLVKNNKVNILFELIGMSDGISKKVVEIALKNKKHVITANKALISKHGEYLSKLAEKNNVNLEFEASVGGGIPVLRTIKDGLATNKISKVVGILNGTSNYILTEMEKTKKSFKEVLLKSQKLGLAEANPKFDLDGSDVLSKVKILSSLAFKKQISLKKCLKEGIENIDLKDIEMAKNLNLRIKLLGITEIINNSLFERVHTSLVPNDNYIANIDGAMNAVILKGIPVGESVLQGEGAGPGPTSSALMSDLLSILRGNIKYPFGIPNNKRHKIKTYNEDLYENSLYLRLEVNDKPGVLSDLTKILAKYKISIQRLIQIPDKKNKKATIVIITHKCLEKNSISCINNLNKNKNVLKNPVLIRLFT
ncbi:MAG: homoserine dehydrogenase [Candidatus Pelagibacter sp.]